MADCRITVFTPTYNRCYTLDKLYKSLCRQTNINFEWLIVDDGSNDDTEKYIKECKKNSSFEIIYMYQENSGKHVAFNRGVRRCDTELFFCVDSDDYLTDNAIAAVLERWNDAKENIAGIVAYRGYSEDRIIGTEFPRDVDTDALRGLYTKGKTGDTALIFKTEILKKYPFKEFPGEKFMRESVVYNQIDAEYKLLILPEIIYIGKYMEDGLSKNAYVHDQQSPNGAALYRLDMFKYADSMITRLFYGIAYCYFIDRAGRKEEIQESLGKGWGTLCRTFLFMEKIRRKLK